MNAWIPVTFGIKPMAACPPKAQFNLCPQERGRPRRRKIMAMLLVSSHYQFTAATAAPVTMATVLFRKGIIGLVCVVRNAVIYNSLLKPSFKGPEAV